MSPIRPAAKHCIKFAVSYDYKNYDLRFPSNQPLAQLTPKLYIKRLRLQPWSEGLEKKHSIHILPLPTPVQC